MGKALKLTSSYMWNIGVVAYVVVLFAFAGFYIVGISLVPAMFEKQGEWFFIELIVYLFLGPYFLKQTLAKNYPDLLIHSLNWLRNVTIALTVMSAILWYLEPSYPRIEPVTFLLGLVAATITYNRDQIIQDLTNTI